MDIEQRVERLERENRRLKIAGGAVVAARRPSRQTDRAAFLYSLIYLPVLLALMLIDRQLI
jgi:heme O synthase-like polyprenyltransferase